MFLYMCVISVGQIFELNVVPVTARSHERNCDISVSPSTGVPKLRDSQRANYARVASPLTPINCAEILGISVI
jgi:hypothetical protein